MGLRVAVADGGRWGMCQGSRLKASQWVYAPPRTQPEQFVQDIVRLLEETGAPFLLPVHDETETLARYRGCLPPQVTLPVADVRLIELANNKSRMAETAARLGLSTPRRVDWKTPKDLEQQLINLKAASVVKLLRGNSAKGVFYPATPKEAAEICARLIEQYALNPERYPLVQERVPGEGWGVSCLYWQGERLASFTHKRLREKTATGGTSTLRESRRNPLLEEMAHCLLDALGWHGLAMVEFKFDPASERGWFIEVNPRLWGSIHLAVASGVDFPALLYCAATQGPEAARRAAGPQVEGLVGRWYLGDMIIAASELAHLHPFQALRLLWPGEADTLDDWFWDDPGAFFGQAAYYLATFLSTRSLNPAQDGMLG